MKGAKEGIRPASNRSQLAKELDQAIMYSHKTVKWTVICVCSLLAIAFLFLFFVGAAAFSGSGGLLIGSGIGAILGLVIFGAIAAITGIGSIIYNVLAAIKYESINKLIHLPVVDEEGKMRMRNHEAMSAVRNIRVCHWLLVASCGFYAYSGIVDRGNGRHRGYSGNSRDCFPCSYLEI